jgi:hypothetical protein
MTLTGARPSTQLSLNRLDETAVQWAAGYTAFCRMPMLAVGGVSLGSDGPQRGPSSPASLTTQLHNRRRVSGVLVAVDDPRLRMVLTTQGFGEKALSRCCIAFSREKEVDCRTAGVHRPVQVHPFAFYPHVRLVHPPRVVGRLEVPAQAPLQFRSIPLDPSLDGDVIHREPTLGQKLLDVAVGSVATLQACRDRLIGCSFWTRRFAACSSGASLNRRSFSWRSAGICASRFRSISRSDAC